MTVPGRYRLFSCVMLATQLVACVGLQTRRDAEEEATPKQLHDQVSAVQKARADQDARISDMQQDMRIYAGRLEALEHNQGQGVQSQQQSVDALKKQLDGTNERIRLLEQHVDAMEMRIMAAINIAAKDPGPPPGASHGKQDVGVVDNRDQGGGHGDAGFAEGERLFNQKDWKKALVAFNKYRDKNPKGKNTSEATYKIGVCFAELGLKKEARAFFEQVLNDYPGTSSARKAKYRLSNMK